MRGSLFFTWMTPQLAQGRAYAEWGALGTLSLSSVIISIIYWCPSRHQGQQFWLTPSGVMRHSSFPSPPAPFQRMVRSDS